MSYRVWVALFVYVLDIAMNLYAAEQRNPKLYCVSKIFLMPLLMLVYFLMLPESVRTTFRQQAMVMALSFHCLGDIFLLFPRNKTKRFFFAGMISFFIGHLFYSYWFIQTDIGHSTTAAFVLVPFLVFFEFFLYGQINECHKKLTIVLLFYSLGLVILAISVISTMGHGTPVWATMISMLGVVLFITSDFNIARKTVGKPLFNQVFTQATYISGQTLIVLGMACLQCFKA